jgi:hypothetical protein
MSELVTKSEAQEQQAQKIETRPAVARIAGFAVVAIAMAALAVLGGAVLYAQGQNKEANNDKYSLVSPGGIAFSDFRGYEDWSAASSARTEAALPDEILKVIVANPTMIKAYKAGVPGNGQLFPEGSMIVKLRCLSAGFRDGEGQQEISENRRLGVRGIQLRRHIGQVHRRSQGPCGLRKLVPCGREGE